MSKSTISTFQLFALFPDEDAARAYLEARIWPDGVRCPECHSGERITVRVNRPGFYRCNACGNFDFTVRTGTVMLYGIDCEEVAKKLVSRYESETITRHCATL